MKLQRNIYTANQALHHFILNNWHFENKNFINLSNDLKATDLKAFYINDFLEYDLILYFRYAVLGARRYLLHEKDDTLPNARKHYLRMKLLDSFLKVIFIGLILYIILVKYDMLMLSKLVPSLWNCTC